MANDTLKEIQNIAAIRELKRRQEKEALTKAGEFIVEKGFSGQHGTPDDVMKKLLEEAYVKKIKGGQLTPNAEIALKEFADRIPVEDLDMIKNKYVNLAKDYGVVDSKGLKNFFPSKGALLDAPVKGGMRAATLGSKLGKGALAGLKMGTKGLKMIPGIGTILGLGVAAATGDVSAAMPPIFDVVKSGKLGEGSDEVPNEDFVSKEELKQILDSQRNQNPDEDDINGVKRPSLDKLRQLIDNSRK